MRSVAIIWDLENVTPPNQNNFFMEKLLDYAGSFGRLTSAKAYCDWTTPSFKRLGSLLARHHFYLVHVPSERKKKNSVDIQLVSDTLESINFYNHIETYVLITGDSDFRSLVLALRRAGKTTHIVCDVNNAADSLLELSDGFIDYRDLMAMGDTEEEVSYESQKITVDQWMQVLCDILHLMESRDKPAYLSAVKVAMRRFHPQFDEKKLGFSRWSDFIEKAARDGYVKIKGGEGDMPATLLAAPRNNNKSKDPLEEGLDELLAVLKELSRDNLNAYHHFSLVNQRLREKGVDLVSLGFPRFKKFAQLAEFKGLVEVKVEGIHYQMRLK
jgi:uncharacterized LabA/DUF88 family protein